MTPAWQHAPTGNQRWWTRERIVAGLRDFVRVHQGVLPRQDSHYATSKKGHMEWPPASRVLEEFGSMARGYLAAGAEKWRVSMANIDWTAEEDEYLLSHADVHSLASIARHLGRTYGAVRARLSKTHGKRARDAQAYKSAAEIAKIYNAPLSRVCRLLQRGELKATKRLGRWRVDLRDAEKIRTVLAAPKTQSYKGTPPDVGDYYRRFGIRRKRLADGRVVRYEGAA